MKILLYLSILFLAYSVHAQQFSKGALVVPKFAQSAIKFDKYKVWNARKQYSAVVAKTDAGLTINGEKNWQGVYPYLAEYTVKEFESSKKKPTRLLLLSVIADIGRSNQIEIIIPSDLDVQNTLDVILFRGSVSEIVQSEYFQNIEKKFYPVMFADGLSAIPFEAQQKLMRLANYSLDAYKLSDFKDKTYLSAKIENTFVYNTLKLNQAARAARQTEDALKLLKSIYEITGKAGNLEGVKITADVYSKSFLDRLAEPVTEKYEMYVSFENLKKFIDAEITNQELIDTSVILLDGSRVKVNLTNFS